MTEPRTVLLDAAIEILGEQGVSGLNHEAVDARAAVPAGSTSDHFHTPEALLVGVAERLVVREQQMAGAAAPEGIRGASDVVRMFSGYARAAVGENRAVAVARYALLVEAAQRPQLRDALGTTGADFNVWAEALLRSAGSRHPARDFDLLANFVTGMVLHDLSVPDPDFDPASRIASLIGTLDWATEET